MSEPHTPTGRKLVAIHGPALLDDVLGIEAEAGVLDEAWAAAEKALPEGWVLSFGSIFPGSVHREKPILYWAGAGPVPEDPETLLGGKDSPAAALHALAAALGRSGSGGGRG